MKVNTEKSLVKVEPFNRKDIALRFLYSIFFLLAFEIARLVVQLTFLFQYVHLFITLRPSEPILKFSNDVSHYAYKLLRYLTLNENRRPFPLTDFPGEAEPREDRILFP